MAAHRPITASMSYTDEHSGHYEWEGFRPLPLAAPRLSSLNRPEVGALDFPRRSGTEIPINRSPGRDDVAPSASVPYPGSWKTASLSTSVH